MSKIKQIEALIRDGLYYLTEHADNEALASNFDIYDIEHAIIADKIRRTWPREDKYEVIGSVLDRRHIGIVHWTTGGGNVQVIAFCKDKHYK